jgi:hypothetical protein
VGIWCQLGQYLPSAWIYLSPSFFENYSIVSSGNGVLKVKSLTSNETIDVDYFLCKKWNSNTDCKQLSTTFADSNEKTFTTQYWTVFYKLSEVSSWFFNNQEFFGYFINNAPEQEVLKLSSFLVLPTADYVKTLIQPKVSSFCKQGNIVLDKVTKTTLFLDKGTLAVNFLGTWNQWTIECVLSLDPSLSSFWLVTTFVYKENTSTWTTVETPVVETPLVVQPQPSQTATNVAQYPIKFGKTTCFYIKQRTFYFFSFFKDFLYIWFYFWKFRFGRC